MRITNFWPYLKYLVFLSFFVIFISNFQHNFFEKSVEAFPVCFEPYFQTDGFGSHALSLLNAIAFCKLHNFTYLHKPWTNVSPHSLESRAVFARKMEDFFSISKYELQFSEKLVSSCKKHFTFERFHWTELYKNMSEYFTDDLRNEFLSRYLSTKKENTPEFINSRAKNMSIIVVHYRQGDVFKYNLSNRILSPIDIECGIMHSLSLLNITKIDIHIHTDGTPQKSKNYFKHIVKKINSTVILHYNDDIRLAFHDMVMADSLVLSRSTFSFCAGLLTRGKVVYFSGFHQIHPLQHWTKIHPNTKCEITH